MMLRVLALTEAGVEVFPESAWQDATHRMWTHPNKVGWAALGAFTDAQIESVRKDPNCFWDLHER